MRAREETQLLALDAHDLDRLMHRVPEIGRRIHEIAHARAPELVAAEPPIAPTEGEAEGRPTPAV